MAASSEQLCKLFVGGLHVDTDDAGLRKHFQQFGTLVEAVVVVNKQLRRSRCFGFVTFALVEQAENAMKSRRQFLDGAAVELKWAVTREEAGGGANGGAAARKVFVGGLKDDIEERHLAEHFGRYGRVERAEVMAEKETRRRRGFGFVHFAEGQAADKAALMRFQEVRGHRVEVKKALSRQEIQVQQAQTTAIMTQGRWAAGGGGGGGGGSCRVPRANYSTRSIFGGYDWGCAAARGYGDCGPRGYGGPAGYGGYRDPHHHQHHHYPMGGCWGGPSGYDFPGGPGRYAPGQQQQQQQHYSAASSGYGPMKSSSSSSSSVGGAPQKGGASTTTPYTCLGGGATGGSTWNPLKDHWLKTTAI